MDLSAGGPPPDTPAVDLLLCKWWAMKCPYRVSGELSGARASYDTGKMALGDVHLGGEWPGLSRS